MHERHECGTPQRAREMGDRVARRDDEVEVHHHRGAVEKRAAALVEALAQRLDLEASGGNVFYPPPPFQRGQNPPPKFHPRPPFPPPTPTPPPPPPRPHRP